MAFVNLDHVAELLRKAGVDNAHVHDAAGGCAIIYAGPTWYDPGWPGDRYAVRAGSGWFEPCPGGRRAVAEQDLLAVGPDDDGERPLQFPDRGATNEQVADLIRRAVERETPRVRYLAAVIRRLERNPNAVPTTPKCPECGEEPEPWAEMHTTIVLRNGCTAVLIGCEGYLVVNPNLVGIRMPNWQPVESGEVRDASR